MKKMKWVFLFLLALVLLFGIVCHPNAASKMRMNKTKLTITEGKKYKLRIKNAKKRKITWKSSNKKVATVSNKGVVKAIKAGKVKIVAKIGTKKYSCKITVKKKKTKTTAKSSAKYIQKLKFSTTGTEELFVVGNTYNFASDITSGNGKPGRNLGECSAVTIKKLARFSSSNTSVATINSVGKATFKKAGKTTITIKAKGQNGWKTCKQTITVVPKNAVSIQTELLVTNEDFKNDVADHHEIAEGTRLFDTIKVTVTNYMPYTVSLTNLEMNDTYLWSYNGGWKNVISNSGWVMIYNSIATLKEDRMVVNIPAYGTKTLTFTLTNDAYRKMRGSKPTTSLDGWIKADGKQMSFTYRIGSGFIQFK